MHSNNKVTGCMYVCSFLCPIESRKWLTNRTKNFRDFNIDQGKVLGYRHGGCTTLKPPKILIFGAL